MKNSFERHPFPPFYNNDIKYLVVGSFPPIKLTDKIYVNDELKKLYENYLRRNPFNPQRDINFYYGSSDNYFWPVLRSIYKKELSNPDQIKTFLNSRGIGITDLFEKCSRKIRSGKIDSSDSNLSVLEYRDFSCLFKSCRELKTIIFTGKGVFSLFKKRYPDADYDSVVLESPSGSFDRNIGKDSEFKEKKRRIEGYNTFEFRCERYRLKLPL